MKITNKERTKLFEEHLDYLFTLGPRGRRKRREWNKLVDLLKREGNWKKKPSGKADPKHFGSIGGRQEEQNEVYDEWGNQKPVVWS